MNVKIQCDHFVIPSAMFVCDFFYCYCPTTEQTFTNPFEICCNVACFQGHKYVFEKEDEEKAKKKQAAHHWRNSRHFTSWSFLNFKWNLLWGTLTIKWHLWGQKLHWVYGKSNNYCYDIHNFPLYVSAAKGVCVNIDIVFWCSWCVTFLHPLFMLHSCKMLSIKFYLKRY